MNTSLLLKVPVFTVAFLLAHTAYSQSERTLLDNINMSSSGGWGGYRSMMTKLNGETAWISGFHMVGEYNRKVIFGYNFNWTTDDVRYFSDQNDRRLRLNWHSIQLGYIVASHKAIHPVFDLDLGIGRAKISDMGRDRIFVAAPGVGIELNLYRWFHLNIGGGYRWVGDASIAGLRNKDLSGGFAEMTLKFGWSDDVRKVDD